MMTIEKARSLFFLKDTDKVNIPSAEEMIQSRQAFQRQTLSWYERQKAQIEIDALKMLIDDARKEEHK